MVKSEGCEKPFPNRVTETNPLKKGESNTPEQARSLPGERPHSNLNSSGATGEPEGYRIPPTPKILN